MHEFHFETKIMASIELRKIKGKSNVLLRHVTIYTVKIATACEATITAFQRNSPSKLHGPYEEGGRSFRNFDSSYLRSALEKMKTVGCQKHDASS